MSNANELPNAGQSDAAIVGAETLGEPSLTRAEVPSDMLDTILEALKGIRYGQITVIVQDGRVVQIDRMERRRFRA